jgi:hypothetical protein
LVLVQAALLLGIAFDKSETFDEPPYLFRSSRLFTQREGLPRYWLTPQWAFAAALFAADPRGDRGRFDLGHGLVVMGQKHPEDWPRLLRSARLTTLVVTLLAGFWIWRAARRFGPAAGLLAHALWVFSPTVLGHGALVNLDAWAAAWSALLLLCTLRFVEAPTLARAAQVGLPLALAASTKAPTLVAVPVVAVVMAWAVARREGWSFLPRAGWAVARGEGGAADRREGGGRLLPWKALLATAAVVTLASLLALWMVYGFTVGPVRSYAPRLAGVAREAGWILPFPVFWETLVSQATYGAQGKTSYLLGEARPQQPQSGETTMLVGSYILRADGGDQSIRPQHSRPLT